MASSSPKQPTHRVSAAQFFLGMLVSQAAATLGLNTQYAGGAHLLDNTVSALLAMGLGVLMVLPAWALQKRCPVEPLPGKAAPLCYLLYFIWEAAASLALFQIFLLDTVNPDFSAGFVAAALLGAGLYGALRGVETIARCGACVFVVLVLGCGLVFGIVALRFHRENLEPSSTRAFPRPSRARPCSSPAPPSSPIWPSSCPWSGGNAPWALPAGAWALGDSPPWSWCWWWGAWAPRRHPELPGVHLGRHHPGAVPPAAGYRVRGGVDRGPGDPPGLDPLRLPPMRRGGLFQTVRQGLDRSSGMLDAGPGPAGRGLPRGAAGGPQHPPASLGHPGGRVPPAPAPAFASPEETGRRQAVTHRRPGQSAAPPGPRPRGPAAAAPPKTVGARGRRCAPPAGPPPHPSHSPTTERRHYP